MREKLKVIKELKARYYIGTKAAYSLYLESKRWYDLESRLKTDISAEGGNPNFGPSVNELAEAYSCITKIASHIQYKIGKYYHSTLNGTDKILPYDALIDKFMDNYAFSLSEIREEKRSESNLLGITDPITDSLTDSLINSLTDSLTDSLNDLLTDSLTDLLTDKTNLEAFSLSLIFYLGQEQERYSKFFKERDIPIGSVKELISQIDESYSTAVKDFCLGLFKGQSEAMALERLSLDRDSNSDPLYYRLKREQIDHKDEMQKLYLTRYIAEKRISTYEDFLTTVKTELNMIKELTPEETENVINVYKTGCEKAGIPIMEDNIEFFKNPNEPYKIESVEYLRLISNRHRRWIQNFFK